MALHVSVEEIICLQTEVELNGAEARRNSEGVVRPETQDQEMYHWTFLIIIQQAFQKYK